MSSELHTTDDGKFVLVRNTPEIKIKITGYTSENISEEKVNDIQEQIDIHGRENLMYNNQQIVKIDKKKK